MNTTANTERPKLKLNFETKPLILNTNVNPHVVGSALKKVVVVEKPITQDTPKAKTETVKKSKKQEAAESNKKAANQNVVAVALTPEEILKEKIKRRKKEYFSILTKLQADFPKVFSEEVKPLAIGIHLELLKMLQGQFSRRQLGIFFHRYCGSFKYQEKLVEGAQRYNLDGTPATLVTKTEIPSIINKPKLVKKAKNSTDVSKTVRNEIQPTQ